MSRDKENLRAKLERERVKQKKEFEAKYVDLIKKANRANKLYQENMELKAKVEDLEEQLRQHREWTERLLEYMDMDEAEFKKLREEAKTWGEITESLGLMHSFAKRFGVLGGSFGV
ncbi:MAG: hypothetical protein J6A59_09290 [Lachnospiraceae bacterium]|nr:hypothetical protein [Lachnospiraceae bacterium]